MTTYTDVFGGANIYPSEISYQALTLSSDVVLHWPEETSASVNFVTKIIDVTPTAAGYSIFLPSAKEASTGETTLLSNKGSFTFTVRDSLGNIVATLDSGVVRQIYLTNNSTVAGVWESLQYGASISSANAASLAGTGIIALGTKLSQSVPVFEFSSNYTASVNERAKLLLWQGAGGTLTLDSPSVVGSDWFIMLRNAGSGTLTVDPTSSVLIDGSSTLDYQPGESSVIVSDGVAFYTVGLGKSATFAFDYTTVIVNGAGDYTLSGSELNRIAYNFTGVLTGDRVIIVPPTVQQYWITNATTGAYTFTVKTAAGSGISLNAGQRAIFYCDGTNIVDADTSTVSLPITVGQGGTGAITSSAALVNLGGSSVGISLFTATDQNGAWSALGNAPIITGGTF